jgi:hypothetical protein
VFSRGVCAVTAQRLVPIVSLKMLSQTPQAFSNLEVRVSGVLTNHVLNYFRDPPRLFLSDRDGYTIRVAPWVPMELTRPQRDDGPPTLSQYLNQTVELTGALTRVEDAIPWIFSVRHAEIVR